MKRTNLKNCKSVAKMLFDAVEFKPFDEVPMLCAHPYTNSPMVYIDGEFANVYEDVEARKRYRAQVFKFIDESITVDSLFTLIRSNYYMCFLRYIKDDLSKDDFSRLLHMAWTEQENPNDDVNVSLKQAVSWFKSANKSALMDEDDYDFYQALPEKFTVYRGVATGHNVDGLSYTIDYDKAIWFMNRFGDKDKKLITLEITKDKALAYFNSRGESEIVVDVFNEEVQKHKKIEKMI